MTSDRIDDLIALAALGELTTEQQRELDAAVEHEPAVAAQLDEALASAAAIQRVHAEPPPARLRAAVLDEISATPQQQSSTSAGPANADDVETLASRRTRRRLRPALLTAAAIVLVAVSGIFVIVTGDDSGDPIAAVVEAPDATSLALAGTSIDLTVTYSASEGALVVRGDDVPVPPASATYQLWLVDDDGATSIGVFRPDDDGSVAERLGNADPAGFVLGLTEEPAGGSETPTLPIIATS